MANNRRTWEKLPQSAIQHLNNPPIRVSRRQTSRIITATELQESLRLHRRWHFGEVGGVRADLSNCNLIDANLNGANLNGANLTGANLNGANLTRVVQTNSFRR